MKLLVTGLAGFVGQNILQMSKSWGDVTIEELDLRKDFKQRIVSKSDIILHLAGKAHDLKKTFQPEEYYKVNYELTKDLYDFFLNSDARIFIFMSSVKAVRDHFEGILTEDIFPNPQTDYGKSKLMAENYIQSQILPHGKSYVILRPCMIHGSGNKGNLNLLYNFVKRGIPYPLASFENKRSFLSIDNLSFIIRELVTKPIPTGIYNVADDESLSTLEVVSIMYKSLDQNPKFIYLPKWIILPVASLGDIIPLPINSEKLSKLTETFVVSNRKIKAVLGKPFPISSSDGIIKTTRSFL